MIARVSEFPERAIALLAELHREALPNSLFALGGMEFLRAYYGYVSRSPLEQLFWEEDSSLVIAGAVLSLEPRTLSRRFFLSAPAANGREVLAAFFGNRAFAKKVVGHMTAKEELPRDIVGLPEVVQIYTSPAHQNKGLGSSLIRKIEVYLGSKNIPKYFLKTRADEKNPAKAFYDKRGFRKIAVTKFAGGLYEFYLKSVDPNPAAAHRT